MLKFYNSITRKKENFKPLKKPAVTMYNCGPTVYDFAHIGNLRSFLFADLLRRYLEYSGLKVKQVMNITDVGHMLEDADKGEDKIEQAAKKSKKTPAQVAGFYTKAFFADIEKLNIKKAYKYPKATEHIKEMIKIIEKLITKGYAYEVPSCAKASEGKNGSVYFNVKKFKNYGKLSGNKLKDLVAGARVEKNPDKKNPYDFALWIHNPKHKMQWNSPWGKGYPGWHIECSAMAIKYLGETIDIHTGGEDNKFPHHEAEIAQSEAATGKKFARFWLHTRHLLVDGKKMSKSKKNFYTLEDLLKKGYSARAIRYLLLSAHYRDPLNFTFKGLDDAERAVKKLDELYINVEEADETKKRTKSFLKTIKDNKMYFKQAMDDDLNISKALAVLFGFNKRINEQLIIGMNKKDKKEALGLLQEFDSVFGFGLSFKKVRTGQIPRDVLRLADNREKMREEKNWKEADKLREKIEKLGYVIEDKPSGFNLKKK